MATSAAHADTRDHFLEGRTGPDWRPRLLLREQIPARGDRSRPVLYIHGSTFPSALSVMFKLEGRSWADDLNARGYDLFALDFAGYGGSERYPALAGVGLSAAEPHGRAQEAAEQIERAVHFILRETGAKRVSIVAHSWGTIAAGRFAGEHPEMVDKLVLFGPVARRADPVSPKPVPPYLDVTIEAQHTRFTGSVPPGEPGVLVEQDFPRWADAYLASDASSRTRSPPSVRVPSGPDADIAAAWSGQFPYDPSLILAPTLIIRGEWDSVTHDADARWLSTALTHAARVETVKVPRATHLMHLEANRTMLYANTDTFLANGTEAMADTVVPPDHKKALFAVVFEVKPDPNRHADYLRIAGELRPELLKVPGFVENERFRSRTRPGYLLSLSLWDSEKALVRWRTVEKHHGGQVEGRAGVLADYHLRVGEVTAATGQYADRPLGWLSQDETEVGRAKVLTIVDSFAGNAAIGGTSCETFDHLTTEGRVASLCEWDSAPMANAFLDHIKATAPAGRTSAYVIRVIRDYGMIDRREAPQFMK